MSDKKEFDKYTTLIHSKQRPFLFEDEYIKYFQNLKNCINTDYKIGRKKNKRIAYYILCERLDLERDLANDEAENFKNSLCVFNTISDYSLPKFLLSIQRKLEERLKIFDSTIIF
jgi:hypothetical protein